MSTESHSAAFAAFLFDIFLMIFFGHVEKLIPESDEQFIGIRKESRKYQWKLDSYLKSIFFIEIMNIAHFRLHIETVIFAHTRRIIAVLIIIFAGYFWNIAVKIYPAYPKCNLQLGFWCKIVMVSCFTPKSELQ
ncbi:MAG TPA: hypothetical protein PL195_09850, partial [bacterium]|nr:hypothetical protein [bacterium]